MLALGALAFPACGDGGDSDGSAAPSTVAPASTASTAPTTTVAGTVTFPSPSRGHVANPVTYPQVPPVGGDHSAAWQNCGFYSTPVVPEAAVHSLEHGAVWITLRPDLPADQVDILRRLANSRSHVLVSPWPQGLPSPVVASGWGVQLELPSASDPRLAAFVAAYAGRGMAPEPGASCSGAFGTPE